jgi:hypothetical protein
MAGAGIEAVGGPGAGGEKGVVGQVEDVEGRIADLTRWGHPLDRGRSGMGSRIVVLREAPFPKASWRISKTGRS